MRSFVLSDIHQGFECTHRLLKLCTTLLEKLYLRCNADEFLFRSRKSFAVVICLHQTHLNKPEYRSVEWNCQQICWKKVLGLFPGWDAAIVDAEKQASEHEQKAVRLKAIADVMRRKRDEGEPWPDGN